ncbi:MAG: nicotinate-nucleotide adenylyltransferase [Rhodobacter sp.]|nr:nicotinate-nucleotide adenylyltransferase [Rhodobacter sp.]MCY4169421.1 nicotinate-nucleotide adenylyltransferase [Rhodobacter sp.]MCY4242394.1 nicotinate-nucleotide adenylyltransferase [Rhodobacter sp.]
MRKQFLLSGSGLPTVRAGHTVGLLGGSFDPPHAGHVHLTREALKRFGLDKVWWLVSPGNPLKTEGPAPLGLRMEAARALIRHPRVTVSDIETKFGTRYTAETLGTLTSRYPGVRFIWLMGADNLIAFHNWERWREIFGMVPIGIVARPGDITAARHSKAARTFSFARLGDRRSGLLPRASAPAWCFVNAPMLNLSSSAIRGRGDWAGRSNLNGTGTIGHEAHGQIPYPIGGPALP